MQAPGCILQSMPRRQTAPGERDLIESLRKRTAASRKPPRNSGPPIQFTSPTRLKLSIGDDCAILEPPRGHEILVTTDFSLETIHFRREWHSPESVGHRCLARGLSDLAAMGAQPIAAFLSLALPAELVHGRRGHPSWRDRFFTGLLALADTCQVPLAGGDTAQSPLHPSAGRQPGGWALADIVLVGSAPRGRALRRSGAKAGDRIYVTGHLGGSAAELDRLTIKPRQFRNITASESGNPNPHPHIFPQPRLAVGAWLLKNRRATAAIDLSDGLSTDLDHLCEESGLAATIDAATIPVHPLATDPTLHPDRKLRLALNGGEDYELLFTASPAMRVPRQIAGVPVARIGAMRRNSTSQPRVLLVSEVSGQKIEHPLPPGGWQHYK